MIAVAHGWARLGLEAGFRVRSQLYYLDELEFSFSFYSYLRCCTTNRTSGYASASAYRPLLSRLAGEWRLSGGGILFGERGVFTASDRSLKILWKGYPKERFLGEKGRFGGEGCLGP